MQTWMKRRFAARKGIDETDKSIDLGLSFDLMQRLKQQIRRTMILDAAM
jgi:hypothetical protein